MKNEMYKNEICFDIKFSSRKFVKFVKFLFQMLTIYLSFYLHKFIFFGCETNTFCLPMIIKAQISPCYELQTDIKVYILSKNWF